MEESILTSIKKLLGISAEYQVFDMDIIMHINTVFVILNQLGVGPLEGFKIEDDLATWNMFTNDVNSLESIRTYIYLKVKLLFDPPLNSAVLESIKQTINELEWRLNVGIENQNDEEV